MGVVPLPKPPASGGHYVLVGGKPQLIHAVGKNQWAPGPPGRGPSRSTAAPASNPLDNPSQPLAGPALHQAAVQLTNEQINGPLAELAKQIAQNNQRGQAASRQTAGYFNALGQQAQSGVDQTGQIGKDLNSTLQGIGQNTQNQLQGIGQQAQQSFAAHAPQGEGGLSTNATQGLAAEMARQQGLAAQNAGTFQAAGANQGANYQSLAASNLGTYGLRGQERLGQLASATQLANAPVLQKEAGLAATRGSLLATNEGKLRQGEINNAITATGLGIKQNSINAANQRSAAQIAAANQRSANSIAAANSRAAASNALATTRILSSAFGAVGKAAAAAAAKRVAKGGSLTQSEQNRVYGTIGQAQALIKQAQAQPGYSATAVKQALQGGNNPSHRSFDPLYVEAAYELNGWGYILPQTAQALHGIGLRGSRYRVGSAPQNKPLIANAGSLSQPA